MNIETEKEYRIFRNENNGKVYYRIGLSHKKQDNTWEHGTMDCRFPKDADIPNKSKIKIHSAWLDFWLKDKVSHPYVFINKYEIITENKQQEEPTEEANEFSAMSINTNYQENEIKINDNDLPF